MIRSSVALAALFEQGRTISKMCDFEGANPAFHWVTTDTNESVHGTAVKILIGQGKTRPIAFDMCGEPMQLGAAS